MRVKPLVTDEWNSEVLIFSVRKLNSDEVFSKKRNLVFLMINIAIIILTVFFLFALGGFGRITEGPVNNEIKNRISELFRRGD